ncbi:N-acetylglucosamine-6-phosphate deacetylase [Bacillus sp. JCM 19034]|uniref:N-acetylglucosamine-6-phosphate deacetylase n=1 Tax=Bacillus sp. JCM 19034 TaxID=1481928 RepID=UPI0007831DD5|nr:N-acetylglucosamine-6-phosphate deacetylase [Bacillus sp. JCM 19034]
MGLIFYNTYIHCENGIINGYLKTEGHKIIEVNEGTPQLNEHDYAVNGKGKHIIPGFIDTHIHGISGADVMDGTSSSLQTMASNLPFEGTTSFLAATMTQAKPAIEQALKAVAKYDTNEGESELLGVHLEGPFINKEKAGAQPKEYVIAPSIDTFDHWQKQSNNRIKVITLAPEMDRTGQFIRHLNESGVIVSAGHTNASMSEIKAGVHSGLRQLTHLCNAMTGIHHRDVGAVGAGFLLKELMCELIVDGLHVSEEMIHIIYEHIGPERIMLITDSMEAKAMPKGTYSLGGQTVKTDGKRALLEDGTLAGSIVKMIDAAHNMKQITNASIAAIIKMTATNPAKQLGVFDRKGSIAIGKDADFLLIDDQFNLIYTICRGTIAFKREGL